MAAVVKKPRRQLSGATQGRLACRAGDDKFKRGRRAGLHIITGGGSMPIVDVQVHAYERNHPGRPWVGHIAGPEHVTGDEMVAAMNAVGVDGAILVSPFALYGFDASYAIEVGAAHPG